MTDVRSSGPAEAAGRRHPDHRSRRDRRQLARARCARAAPANAPPWSRPTPMAAASSRSRPRSRRPAATPSSSPISPKARRVRARRAGGRDSMCSTGCCPAPRPAFAEAQPAAGDRQSDRTRRMGRASSRHQDWHGGAALHVDTGMNRLGLALEEAAQLAPRMRARSRHRAADEPPRLRRRPDHPLNDKQIELFREVRALFPRHPGSLANSSGHLPRARRALRSGAARRRALSASIRRRASRTRCSRWSTCEGRIVQVRDVPQGETVGYGATWTAQRPTPHRHRRGRLCRRLPARRERVRQRSAAPRRSSRGKRCPIAGRVSMDLIAVDVTDLPGERGSAAIW